MNTPDLIFVTIISILLILVSILIGRGRISAKLGGTIVLLSPLLVYFIIVIFWEKGEILNAICVGSLLSLAFGPATYVFGRILEKKAKERKNIIKSNE